MKEYALNRLTIFEALLFGIYGNWLISFVDKITLPYADIRIFLEYSFVSFSFLFLIILIAWALFNPKKLTGFWVIALGIGHFVCNIGALYVEGITTQYIFFLAIGLVLFGLIVIIQYQRIKLANLSLS